MSQWHRLGIPTTIPDGMDDIPEIHTVTVRDRYIKIDYPTLIQNNVKTDQVTLDLDGEWDGLSVLINLGDCPNPVSLVWTGSPVTIPAAVMADVGGVDVSVVGTSADGTTRLVTAAAGNAFTVIKSGCDSEGDVPEDPTSVLGQLIQAAENAEDAAAAANGAAGTANAAASAANTAAGKATTAATEATGAAGEATDAAEDATRAAQTANAAAEAAGAAAEAARGNVLKGALGPAPLLSADDAYATKPRRLTVYGNTRQNLWANPSGTSNGVTVTSNEDGSLTLSGTATSRASFYVEVRTIKSGQAYRASVDRSIGATVAVGKFAIARFGSSGEFITQSDFGVGTNTSIILAGKDDVSFARCLIFVEAGQTVSGTYRVMLNEGGEAEPWCPPGLNSVDELAIVVSTTDSADDGTTTPIDLDGHALNSLPDGTRDELRIDGTGAVTLTKRVGAATFDGSEDEAWRYGSNKIWLNNGAPGSVDLSESNNGRCDTLPVRPLPSSPAIMAYDTGWVDIRNDAAITNLESGKAWLAANHTTLLYPLATPETISLPAVTLPTLPAPTCNVYADAEASGTGYAMGPDVEMEYERDVTIAFDKLHAQVSALNIMEATNG